MDLQLRGKRALVTGSTAGIGEGIAKALAAEGARVVVHGRNAEAAERVASEIRLDGGESAVALGDLATDEHAQRVAREALEAFGGIDVLVNNAGVLNPRGFSDTEPGDWASLYETNVVSVVRMVKELGPPMRQAGWGRMIQISSGVATMPAGGVPADYAATKAALVNLTVSLSQEYSGTGVTVNTVSPGPVATAQFRDMWSGIAKRGGFGSDEWAEVEQRLVEGIMSNPSDRLGTVEDVGRAVAFLSSPITGYINGANLRVDGGITPVVN